jgi:acetyl esterase/lipase
MHAMSESEVAARLDPELAGRFGTTLPPHLPVGELTVALVREIDERISVRPDATAESTTIERSDRLSLDQAPLELRFHHKPSPHVILWIHGGGMFLGAARYDDALTGELAETLGVSVASVDYRLAPEHPHPEPLEDCYTALEWLSGRYDRVIVAGGSAGGGLALGLALLARDRSGPAIAGVQAWYPMLDDRSDRPSATLLAHTEVWNGRLHDLSWSAYLGAGRADEYAAPARAIDLGGLPPTFIDVGELDIFHDEDADYAARLAAAGVPVEFHDYPKAVHAFEAMNPDAAVSRLATARRIAWLTAVLNDSTTPATEGAAQ